MTDPPDEVIRWLARIEQEWADAPEEAPEPGDMRKLLALAQQSVELQGNHHGCSECALTWGCYFHQGRAYV